jgi:DNA-binding CsgD family transcriptional regulator
MAADNAHLFNLIGTLYDTAIDPSAWNLFLRQWGSGANDGCNVNTIIFDKRRKDHNVLPYVYGIEDRLLQGFVSHYHQFNPYAPLAMNFEAGVMIDGTEMTKRFREQGNAFVNEWMPDAGVSNVLGGAILRSADVNMVLSMQHPWQSERDIGRVMGELEILMPHLQKAALIGNLLGEYRQMSHSLQQMLDCLNIGCLLLGHKGNVLYHNQRAQEILREQDGLSLLNGQLSAWGSADHNTLQAAIQKSCAFPFGIQDGVRDIIRIKRRQGRSSYHLLFAPVMGRHLMTLYPQATAIVFIKSPEDAFAPPLEQIAHLYGFTNAESKLATSLAQGQTLEEFSAANSITRETVKAQLKQVTTKLGVSRQAEVVRDMLQGLAGFVK